MQAHDLLVESGRKRVGNELRAAAFAKQQGSPDVGRPQSVSSISMLGDCCPFVPSLKLSDTCLDEPPHENRWWHVSSCSQHLRVKNPASLYHSPYRSRIIDIGERISIQQDDVR